MLFMRLFLIAYLILGVVHGDDYELSHDEEPNARLLVYKSSSNNKVVEGLNFTISYKIFNTGNGIARDIELFDRYDPHSFLTTDEKVGKNGVLHLSYDEMDMNAEYTYTLTVIPLLSGLYESTPARIQYATGLNFDDDDVSRKGYSTSLGKIQILTLDEYKVTQSYFMKEWLLFIIGSLTVTAYPFYKYYMTRSNNLKFMSNLKEL